MTSLKRHPDEPLAAAIAKDAVILLLFNTAVAALAALLDVAAFAQTLLFSQAIGISIFAMSWSICLHRGTRAPDWKSAVIAIPVGACLGVVIASLASGIEPAELVRSHPGFVQATLGLALVFGSAISYYFYSRGQLAEAAAELQRQRSERLADERSLIEARLRLLQAQIEPHFLFNTLSNVLSLIRSDPAAAERMLENLTRYLRASFRATRREEVPLAEELALVDTYLAIQAVRMGSRLEYDVDVAEELRAWPVPPFVLQPLVENAVKHGVEPQAAGGRITVSARRAADGLHLVVSDTGPGVAASGAPGVGLANVRERLEARYGAAASMLCQSLVPSGFSVALVLPGAGA